MRTLALALVTVALAGCMDGGDESMDGAPSPGTGMDGGMDNMSGMMGDGDGAAEQLAMARADALPEGELAWVAYDVPAAEAAHAHGPAFVYAANASARLRLDADEAMLMMGEARFVGEGEEHTHGGAAWEIRLESADAEAPEGATRLFASGALRGIPDAPVDLRFVRVTLPPGGMTAVHAHPGPEYVWVARGEIVHESAEDGERALRHGEDHDLPADTAVQKRNPGGDEAVFLSLFVVDPDAPFATDASFG